MSGLCEGASSSSPVPVAASAGSTPCCSRRRAPRSSSTTSAAPVDGSGTDAGPGPAGRRRDQGRRRRGRRQHRRHLHLGRRARASSQQAIDTFGTLDVLVNNAGILRDRMMVNMTEAEWDAVIKVHLKGTFGPRTTPPSTGATSPRPASRSTRGSSTPRSPSGIFGNVGQTNYGAAKAGIAAFTHHRRARSSAATASPSTRSPRPRSPA